MPDGPRQSDAFPPLPAWGVDRTAHFHQGLTSRPHPTHHRLLEVTCVSLGRWAATWFPTEASLPPASGAQDADVAQLLVQLARTAFLAYPGETALHKVCGDMLAHSTGSAGVNMLRLSHTAAVQVRAASLPPLFLPLPHSLCHSFPPSCSPSAPFSSSSNPPPFTRLFAEGQPPPAARAADQRPCRRHSTALRFLAGSVPGSSFPGAAGQRRRRAPAAVRAVPGRQGGRRRGGRGLRPPPGPAQRRSPAGGLGLGRGSFWGWVGRGAAPAGARPTRC